MQGQDTGPDLVPAEQDAVFCCATVHSESKVRSRPCRSRAITTEIYCSRRRPIVCA
jgi:hypothetical protein